MRKTFLVCVSLLALAGPAGAAIARPLYPLCGDEKLRSCVLDGNTFWYGGEFMRLKAINPPAQQVACASSTADAARDRLMKLLNTGEIFVFRYGTDDEGHTLSRVLVEGREVGETLIAEGLAQPSSASTGAFCS
ncbi:MAG: thermonuclease family protein [Devosia sp.]